MKSFTGLVTVGIIGTITVATSHAANTTVATSPSWACTPIGPGAGRFWYETFSDGPYNQCTTKNEVDGKVWGMLRAYRSGGMENVHWKYTQNDNDPDCMADWIFYASNGNDVLVKVPGRTTTYGSNRKWCGLPVYRSGGVQGKQWEYCTCVGN
jgi:hypothetical protein